MTEILTKLGNEELNNIIENIKLGANLESANRNPIEFFQSHGIELPQAFHYEIFLSDDKTYYFVIPTPMNENIDHEQLQLAIGGIQKTIACAGSAGCLSTLMTASTIGSIEGATCVFCLSTILTTTSASTASTNLTPASRQKS